MNRFAVAAAVCVTAVVTACSGASNSGGDTTCADFLAMGNDDKDATVARMLKERNGSNSSAGDVVAKRIALEGFCLPGDKQGSKIGDLG